MLEIFASAFYGLFATKEILRFLVGVNISSLCTCQAEVANEDGFSCLCTVRSLSSGHERVIYPLKHLLHLVKCLWLHDTHSSAVSENHCKDICSTFETPSTYGEISPVPFFIRAYGFSCWQMWDRNCDVMITVMVCSEQTGKRWNVCTVGILKTDSLHRFKMVIHENRWHSSPRLIFQRWWWLHCIISRLFSLYHQDCPLCKNTPSPLVI